MSAVTAPVPAMFNVFEAKLHVGRCTAPDGEEVSAQERYTAPVNPLPGVTVTVELLFVVAPGDPMVTGVATMLKGGRKPWVTTRDAFTLAGA